VPVAVDQAERLRYPIGIADVEILTAEAIDLTALRRVSFFFHGGADTNDSVPNSDSFARADTVLINGRFGNTILAPWWTAQWLYHRAGLNAEFKLMAFSRATRSCTSASS
jgi:hypothetical protein